MSEEADKHEAYRKYRRVQATYISQQVHYRVDLSVIDVVLLIIPHVNRYQKVIALIKGCIIDEEIRDLQKLQVEFLSQLHIVILQLGL